MTHYHDYCTQKVIKSGSSFYYSFLFLPTEKKQAIMAIYAFCREVDDLVDDYQFHEIAVKKLAWWQEEVERIYQSQAQHPVGLAIQSILAHFPLKKEYFLEIISGMAMDLHHVGFENFNALKSYCYKVASAVGLLVCEVFGYQNTLTLAYAENLGIAFQLVNIIRDIAEDAKRGRIYLPQDELNTFGITKTDILNCSIVNQKAFKALMQHQTNRARSFYELAISQLPKEDRYHQKAGLIMARIYFAILEKIEANQFNIFERRITISPFKKLWLAWKTARQENRHLAHIPSL